MQITKDNINIDNLTFLIDDFADDDDNIHIFMEDHNLIERFCNPTFIDNEFDCNGKCKENLISFLMEKSKWKQVKDIFINYVMK